MENLVFLLASLSVPTHQAIRDDASERHQVVITCPAPLNHRGSILQAAVAPNNLVASASSDSSLALSDPLPPFTGGTGVVFSLVPAGEAVPFVSPRSRHAFFTSPVRAA
ncbi:hypothetical protein EYF80_006573 [Liparis tanakae]|uniref:Uncharacterized protein n=1 Tax=Liparis tanakae TaxID=230148 RepID=A0A4Z2IZ36_9TELE|nr:hypothetical protein EYF80_006573 [Liparis tanakae]